MLLNQRGSLVGFLLLHVVTAVTSPAGSSSARSSQPHLSFSHDRSRKLLNIIRLTEKPQDVKKLQTEDSEGSRGRPEEPLKHKMAPTSSIRGLTHGDKGEPQVRSAPPEPPTEDCTGGNIQQVIRGKFTITGRLKANTPGAGYQADSAVSAQGDPQRARADQIRGSEESWLRLQPEVECGDEGMTLTVRRRRAVQLLLHRDNESSVPLSQLSPQCGYSVQTTWKDLSLKAQYDACHVTQEDDHHVLPLLWRGTPVKMSCPLTHLYEAGAPPSLCCSPYSLTVKLQGLAETEEPKVNVRGEWTPLVTLADYCGYTLERQDAEIIIAAPYLSCGITEKDGSHALALQIGEKTFALACTVFPTSTPQPQIQNHQPPLKPAEPPPWAPPFYLAPPFYPHPTHHHPPHDVRNPPTPSPVAPETTSSTPPPSTADHQAYRTPQTPAEGHREHFRVQTSPSETDNQQDRPITHNHPPSEAPPLQPPSHAAYSPYYHYYHHPKIPLTGPTKDPDPGPDRPGEPSPRSIKPTEAFSSPPPPLEGPESPPLPFLYPFFYYFPNIDQGEDSKSAPPSLKIDDLSSKSDDIFLHNSTENHLNPYEEEPKPNERTNNGDKSADRSETPLLLKEEHDDLEDEEVATNPRSPRSTPSSYPPFYLHPFSFYQLLYGPADHNHEFLTSSQQDSDLKLEATPPSHPSFSTPPAARKPTHNDKNEGQRPHDHIYDLEDQEGHPAGDTNFKSGFMPRSHFDDSRMEPSLHDAEAGYPSMQQPPPHDLYGHQLSQLLRYSAFGGPDEEEEDMEDQLKVISYPPSSRGLAWVSDVDCSATSGCCLYYMSDCPPFQYLFFLVPDSSMEPLAPPSAHSEVFDQTDPSEGPGVSFLQQDPSCVHEDSTIRSQM